MGKRKRKKRLKLRGRLPRQKGKQAATLKDPRGHVAGCKGKNDDEPKRGGQLILQKGGQYKTRGFFNEGARALVKKRRADQTSERQKRKARTKDVKYYGCSNSV